MTHWQVQPPLCLNTHALSVGRGDTVLAAGIAISVPAGSGLLLRGPNGAGKSTLLLTLAGLLPPLSGKVTLEGYDAEDAPPFHHCGHANAIRPRLSVFETLSFWRALNGPTGVAVAIALDRVGLARQSLLDAAYLSAGQQRRLALARLLVSRRLVWLLDEPTAALDADGQTLLLDLLGAHLDEGGIAVIATHDVIAHASLSVMSLGERT